MADAYDLVVIGGGPAGEKAAAQAAFWGKRVAVVDKSPRPGGALVGGVVASKTMREAALYLTSFLRRDIYEVGMSLAPDVAAKRLRERTAAVVDTMSSQAATNLERHHVDFVQGTAALGPERTVIVGNRTLRAEAIIIATGSRPFHPHGVAFDDPDILDSDTAALLDQSVKSLVVIGGGAVGCEFASIFTALGAEVTLAESGPRILPYMDAELADLLASTFITQGTRMVFDAGYATAARTADGIRVDFSSGDSLVAEKVIFATGRVGNTEDLNLEAIGVETDQRGRIVVDDHFQTTAEGVYAAGDVIGPPALASVSMEQARIAARWAFDLPLKGVADSLAPYGVYGIPEAAGVGMTEAGAAEKGVDVAVGRATFALNTRASISGTTVGVIKLVFDRRDLRLLGVHIVGDAATELVHIGQMVIQFGGTIEHFVHSAFNVPTLSEAYKYAAYDGLRNAGR